jgi:hypothetical protein
MGRARASASARSTGAKAGACGIVIGCAVRAGIGADAAACGRICTQQALARKLLPPQRRPLSSCRAKPFAAAVAASLSCDAMARSAQVIADGAS